MGMYAYVFIEKLKLISIMPYISKMVYVKQSSNCMHNAELLMVQLCYISI